jgi:type I restriction enzyme S subunit
MSIKSKSTATKEEPTPALVPKLRFPEFRDAEGWAQKQLIDTADRTVKWSFIGGPFGSNLKSSDYVPDGIRIIQLQNIGDGEFFDDYRIYTSAEKADELLSNNIYPGEIIMSKMGDPVGRACLIPEWHDRYVMCSDGIRLVVDEKQNEKYFIYSLINAPLFRDVVEKTATGSTRKRIGLDDLKSLPMWLPKKAEQQKIAECLSSVDELIAAQARKLDALKTHKKGLMQQLFPREGETQPRLRFPEFRNAGEWRGKTFGDVSEVLMCKRIFAEETNPNAGVPFYKIGTLGGVPDAFISREKFQDYKSRYNYPRKGEVLITCSGTVGKCLPFDGKDAYFQDSNIVWLDNPTGEVSNEFLFMLLSNVNWGGLNSTTITRIYGPDLRGMAIKYPEDKAEQQRIADCLTSLDDLIAAQVQKLEALKTHKKGLMQQLFPSPEEVSA